MKFCLVFHFFIAKINVLCAQNDTIKDNSKILQVSAFADFYYSYDFSNQKNHLKPDFIYSHKRHNEFNINLLFVKSQFVKDKTRANLALLFGNYAQYNLANEPDWAKFLLEANAGIKLSKKHDLWLDAGIFPSHIGFESAISMDCKTLTRSMLADNSPYYESGLRTVYTTASGKFLAGLYILNGWQRIQKPEHYNKPSAGFQLNYKPNSKWQINYSNFIGFEKPDSVHSLCHFHNFYLIFESKKKNGFILGFDIGSDKNANLEKGIWFSPVIISWLKISPKISINGRFEYYHDPKQIIMTTQTPNGFQTYGISSGIDIFISDQIFFRNEVKSYYSKDAIFLKQVKSNFSLTSSLAIKIP